jgi:Tfp pilus assembly protein FimV
MKPGKKASIRVSCANPYSEKGMNITTAILVGTLLFATLPVRAQSQDSSSAVNPSAEKKKPKKVWTNDEIGKGSDGVSVVGEAGAQGNDSKKKPDSPANNNDPRQRQIHEYKAQLAQLQSRIDAIDKRINQLKNFKGENTSPSGGINMNQGYTMVPIPDQIKQLEEKKRQLRAKMDDVETEAHKNGISSDDLR